MTCGLSIFVHQLVIVGLDFSARIVLDGLPGAEGGCSDFAGISVHVGEHSGTVLQAGVFQTPFVLVWNCDESKHMFERGPLAQDAVDLLSSNEVGHGPKSVP